MTGDSGWMGEISSSCLNPLRGHTPTCAISTWLRDNPHWGYAHGLHKWLYYVSLRIINTYQPNHKSAVSVLICLFNLEDGDKDELFYYVNNCIYYYREEKCIPYAVLNGSYLKFCLWDFFRERGMERGRKEGDTIILPNVFWMMC